MKKNKRNKLKLPGKNDSFVEIVDFYVKLGAVRARYEHKKNGRSIFVSKNGKVVEVPPEDITIPEDDIRLNWINLNNYTYDPDDDLETLTYTVQSVTNSAFMNVYITSTKDRTKNILNIEPEVNFDGESEVTLRVEDDDHNFALEMFKITITPKPDVPTVKILAPNDNSFVSGNVIFSGSASDVENELEVVEIKIGNSEWVQVDGL